MDDKYQVMPPLTDEEYNELKADIAERGVMVPIEFDEDGNILDGYHRYKICQELDITNYPVIKRFDLPTEEAKLEHAVALNAGRRSLTEAQKKEAVLKIIEEHPEFPFRRIARIFKVNVSTVSRWAKNNECPGVADATTGQHEGSDGKIYEGSKETLEAQRENIRQAIQETPEKSDRQIARETGASPTTVGNQRRNMSEIAPDPEPEPGLEPERYEYSIGLGSIERDLRNSIEALDASLKYIVNPDNKMFGSAEFNQVITEQLNNCENIINKYRRILNENA